VDPRVFAMRLVLAVHLLNRLGGGTFTDVPGGSGSLYPTNVTSTGHVLDLDTVTFHKNWVRNTRRGIKNSSIKNPEILRQLQKLIEGRIYDWGMVRSALQEYNSEHARYASEWLGKGIAYLRNKNSGLVKRLKTRFEKAGEMKKLSLLAGNAIYIDEDFLKIAQDAREKPLRPVGCAELLTPSEAAVKNILEELKHIRSAKPAATAA